MNLPLIRSLALVHQIVTYAKDVGFLDVDDALEVAHETLLRLCDEPGHAARVVKLFKKAAKIPADSGGRRRAGRLDEGGARARREPLTAQVQADHRDDGAARAQMGPLTVQVPDGPTYTLDGGTLMVERAGSGRSLPYAYDDCGAIGADFAPLVRWAAAEEKRQHDLALARSVAAAHPMEQFETLLATHIVLTLTTPAGSFTGPLGACAQWLADHRQQWQTAHYQNGTVTAHVPGLPDTWDIVYGAEEGEDGAAFRRLLLYALGRILGAREITAPR